MCLLRIRFTGRRTVVQEGTEGVSLVINEKDMCPFIKYRKKFFYVVFSVVYGLRNYFMVV